MNSPDEKRQLERCCVRVWRGRERNEFNFLGTGCLISPTHILTAAHVPRQADDEELVVDGQNWATPRTVRRKPHYYEPDDRRALRRDVAVLELSSAGEPATHILPLENPKLSQRTDETEIFVGGFTRHTGEGLRTRRLYIENYHDLTDSYMLGGALEPGMSGGPVVRGGNLVGIAYATNQTADRAYIVPLAAVRSFLRNFAFSQTPLETRLSKSRVKALARWVDRHDQISEFVSHLKNASPPGKPILALLTCREEDRHSYFRQRIEEGEAAFNPDSDYANVLTGLAVHDVQFGERRDVDAAVRLLKEHLRSELSASSMNADDIRNAMNNRHAAQVIFGTIAGVDGRIGAQREELVSKWLDFVEEVAAGSQADGSTGLNYPLVIVFCVVNHVTGGAPGKSLFGRFFGRPARGRQIEEWRQTLVARKGGVLLAETLSEMSAVFQRDVEVWIKTLARHLGGADVAREALVEVPDIVPLDGCSMADFIKSLSRFSFVQEVEPR